MKHIPTTVTTQPKALIIGCGIAGPVVAMALQRAGSVSAQSDAP